MSPTKSAFKSGEDDGNVVKMFFMKIISTVIFIVKSELFFNHTLFLLLKNILVPIVIEFKNSVD